MFNFSVSVGKCLCYHLVDLPAQGSCSVFQYRPFLSIQQTNQKQITQGFLLKLKLE